MKIKKINQSNMIQQSKKKPNKHGMMTSEVSNIYLLLLSILVLQNYGGSFHSSAIFQNLELRV
jgi:hypothetical protein